MLLRATPFWMMRLNQFRPFPLAQWPRLGFALDPPPPGGMTIAPSCVVAWIGSFLSGPWRKNVQGHAAP